MQNDNKRDLKNDKLINFDAQYVSNIYFEYKNVFID